MLLKFFVGLGVSKMNWQQWSLGAAILEFVLLGVPIAGFAQAAPPIVQTKIESTGSIIRRIGYANERTTAGSQLVDIRSTDWAFGALRSLVERYGCNASYLNQADRSLSRSEFALVLNNCLERVSKSIAAGTTDPVRQEDLEVFRKLQAEFAAELATLKDRVDVLETGTTKLAQQQFSTTTKLSGEAIFSITGGGSGDPGIRSSNTTPNLFPSGDFNPGGNAQMTAVARVRLNLSTSFTGQDLLFTQLQTGNGGQTAGVLGQDPGLGGNIRFNTFDLDYSSAGSGVGLNYLFYQFPLGRDLLVTLGPVDAVNNYFDGNTYTNDEALNFSSTFFKNNPLLFPVPGGAVGSLRWNPQGGAVSLRAVYTAGSAQFPNFTPANNQGLFGAPYQGSVELEYAPKRGDDPAPLAVRLQYTGASVNNRDYSIGGVNAEWTLSNRFAVFGRYGFGTIDGRNPNNFDGFAKTTFNGSKLSPATWSIGMAFPDLFIPGSKAAIAIGQPFVETNVGNATQTNLEAFYRIPLTKDVAITPDLQVIWNTNNNAANNPLVIGAIRMVLLF